MNEELLAALARLDARLDSLEHKVDRLDAFGNLAGRIPTITDAAGTMAAHAWQTAEAEGIDPIAAGQRVASLGVSLGKAENLDLAEKALASGPVLSKLMDRVDVLEKLLDQVPLLERVLDRRPLLEKLLDAADAAKEEDIVDVATRGAALSGKLAALLRAPALARLLDATADATTLATAEAASTALVEARKAPAEQVGLFGVMGKMGDPDVKRAVGFTFALARRFGQLLEKPVGT